MSLSILPKGPKNPIHSPLVHDSFSLHNISLRLGQLAQTALEDAKKNSYLNPIIPRRTTLRIEKSKKVTRLYQKAEENLQKKIESLHPKLRRNIEQENRVIFQELREKVLDSPDQIFKTDAEILYLKKKCKELHSRYFSVDEQNLYKRISTLLKQKAASTLDLKIAQLRADLAIISSLALQNTKKNRAQIEERIIQANLYKKVYSEKALLIFKEISKDFENLMMDVNKRNFHVSQERNIILSLNALLAKNKIKKTDFTKNLWLKSQVMKICNYFNMRIDDFLKIWDRAKHKTARILYQNISSKKFISQLLLKKYLNSFNTKKNQRIYRISFFIDHILSHQKDEPKIKVLLAIKKIQQFLKKN
jgi:hypothetical protein